MHHTVWRPNRGSSQYVTMYSCVQASIQVVYVSLYMCRKFAPGIAELCRSPNSLQACPKCSPSVKTILDAPLQRNQSFLLRPTLSYPSAGTGRDFLGRSGPMTSSSSAVTQYGDGEKIQNVSFVEHLPSIMVYFTWRYSLADL